MNILSNCPAPLNPETIQLAHGGGGRRMRKLIQTVFLPAFQNPALLSHHDSAVVSIAPLRHPEARLAFTADGYVVHPLFFPGGDIGRLSVFGTVNDLAAAGALPLHLSASFILEEGLPIETLERVVLSMRDAAAEANITIVTGDTKVVDRGKGDGIFVCTSGIGVVGPGVDVAPRRVRPGDAVIVSGDVGRHGMAILSVREGLSFQSPIESDCAPLHSAVLGLLAAGVSLHCVRDLTRGGLASALNEIAEDGGVSMTIDEAAIPVCSPVAGACEMFGLDPLYVACEGRMVLFVPEAEAENTIKWLHNFSVSKGAARIGRVDEGPKGRVALKTALGSARLLDLLSGDQLPRIC